MIKFHKIWLLICVIAGVPIAGVTALLIIAAIGMVVEKQSMNLNDSVGICFLVAAMSLFVWCIVLGLSLRGLTQIPERTRPRLLAFYAVSGIASAVTTTSTWSSKATSGMIFSPTQAIVITVFFLVPILALWTERNSKPKLTSQ